MSRVSMVNNYNMKHALGWSQDASDFAALKKVVSLFKHGSDYNKELSGTRIPLLVNNDKLVSEFQKALEQNPVRISYRLLVGAHSKPRSQSPCSGIIQAAVEGQKRPYLSDWAADSYLCWAHLCGFVKYNGEDETFEITDEGSALTATADGSDEEREILVTALLRYPPVARILHLLSGGEHLSKFELGSSLGFIGEDGFTSLPQNVLLQSLAETDNPKEKSKMKSDWDGSSDKYARQICSWLTKLGLVTKKDKIYEIQVGGLNDTETLGQAYEITPLGLKAYRRTRGINKVPREPKNVFWEMLCTKGRDRYYIRNRRAYIIKFLSDSAKALPAKKIVQKLAEAGFEEPEETVIDDIKGLVNIGLFVKDTKDGYVLSENIQSLVIPNLDKQGMEKSDTSKIKDECRRYLSAIPHNYLDLIDIAFDKQSNRMFEMEVIDLLTSQCGYEGLHLGGALKPDGIIYTNSLTGNYGTIIDTKAYESGYNLPKSQADEMNRYVNENIKRDEELNPNKWWENFPNGLSRFSFMFVSGSFTGNIEDRLQYIARNTNTDGGAINIADILYLAEDIKTNRLPLDQVYSVITPNARIKYIPQKQITA